MRNNYMKCLLLLGALSTGSVYAQNAGTDSTGLPGDNFSLQGALAMFKKAASPEDLEKLINTEGNGVNNLDLNGDGEIDYVKVVAKKQNDAHVFVLQDIISATESQDIAVIELEKTGASNAVVQIVGDEDIYGDTTIVEPTAEGETSFNESRTEDEADLVAYANAHGPRAAFAAPPVSVVVNVWAWPCVSFVYGVGYNPWISPWGWHRYPTYWHAWRPMPWQVYHPICNRYYPRYAVVPMHRVMVAHTIYRPARVSSVTVYHRNQVVVRNYRTTRVIHTAPAGPRGGRVVTQRPGNSGGRVYNSSSPRSGNVGGSRNGGGRTYNTGGNRGGGRQGGGRGRGH